MAADFAQFNTLPATAPPLSKTLFETDMVASIAELTMEDAAPNTDLATGTAAHNMEDAPCAAPFTIFYATEPRPD